MGELGSHGQVGALGLEAVLVSYVLKVDVSAVRSGVSEEKGFFYNLDKGQFPTEKLEYIGVVPMLILMHKFLVNKDILKQLTRRIRRC